MEHFLHDRTENPIQVLTPLLHFFEKYAHEVANLNLKKRFVFKDNVGKNQCSNPSNNFNWRALIFSDIVIKVCKEVMDISGTLNRNMTIDEKNKIMSSLNVSDAFFKNFAGESQGIKNLATKNTFSDSIREMNQGQNSNEKLAVNFF